MLTPGLHLASAPGPRALPQGHPLIALSRIALPLLILLAGRAHATPPDPAPTSPPATNPAATDTATPPSEARVALTPILARPGDPSPSPATEPSAERPLPVVRSLFRLDPINTLLSWHGLDAASSDGRILLSSWIKPRGPALDTERSPVFSDRTDIHVSSNIPGDHSPTQFKVAELQLADGFFFRTEGIGRSYTADTRYLTFSAEAYLAISERAGFAFGLDVLRTGIPEERFGLPEDGLFARFQFDF